jgi:O-antigen/teichoic acid export membrane protein
MTIASLQTVLSLADFGLGNSLLNAVAGAFGNKDETRIWWSIRTALKMQCVIASILSAAFLAIYPLVNWARLLNISDPSALREVGPTILIFFLATCIGSIVAVVQQAQFGLQRGYIANFWAVLGNGTALIGVVLAVKLGAGLPTLCLALVGCPVIAGVVNIVSWLWYSYPKRREIAADATSYRSQMLHVGLQFFVLQATAALIAGIDPIIVTQTLGPASVVELSVVQKPFELLSAFMLLLLQPLWPAYREAIVARDVNWVRNTLRRVLAASLAFAGIAGCAMAIAGKYLIFLWAGPDVHPTTGLIVGYGIANVLATFGTQASFFFNAMGKIYFQLAIAVPAALVALLMKIFLTKHLGLVAIPWITAGVWLSMTAPAQIVYMRRLIRQLTTMHI